MSWFKKKKQIDVSEEVRKQLKPIRDRIDRLSTTLNLEFRSLAQGVIDDLFKIRKEVEQLTEKKFPLETDRKLKILIERQQKILKINEEKMHQILEAQYGR